MDLDRLTRRDALWHTGGGLGGIALAYLLGRDGLLAQDGRPLPRQDLNSGLHYRAKAKRVVQLFMSGAASQSHTFDYNPDLIPRHGHPFNPPGPIQLFHTNP